MKCFPASLALLAFAWSHSVLATETGVFAWPEGWKAAVSLAYDDALDSQLDNAIPRWTDMA